MTYLEKLNEIRRQMKADNVQAYIIPSADPHISEYLPRRYKCIPFASGFSGSAGALVITQDTAGLWTDFRYFEQAADELKGSGFELMKQKVQHAPEYIQWLTEKFDKGATVAADDKLLSVLLGEMLTQKLSVKGISLSNKDYLSPIWKNRPELPSEKAFLIEEQYTGQSVRTKLEQLRAAMQQQAAGYHLISSLDDLAWLFNIRGKDVNYNPVVLSFALISQDYATLYIDVDKLSSAEKETLLKSGVEVLPYGEIEQAITHIPADSNILIDPKRNCFAFYKLVPSTVRIIKDTNPTTNLKAVKNETELSNTRAAMLKDGLAITRFLKWLSENIGKTTITELSAAAELRKFRLEQPGFIGDSFNTISAYKAHAALPHYGASEESNAAVKAEGLFLVDSGGQYYYGTTDITRTIPMGNNTEEESTDYTLVLKGMIDGCKARFPKGTCGYQIDAITRKPLWDYAINYGHGTGHGVGYFLNVHEGPQVFNPTANPVPVEPGMITSVEPGVYRPGKHGIRIENLVNTIRDVSNEFNEFYAFECLTIAPISTKIVKKDLLEAAQLAWLNNYNAMVFEKLGPLLTPDEAAWLKEETKAI
ncbi:aminopeptidase P family protein [Pedobacter heparinus]|uniref:Xaa-Pro aminopeptidase n=1 Tax=Pedobacter heparinus (strain ATCC 13125 / DSM 2366 / CIP 104194 / JCM 7457 / NBRC 12017 / NCIMB 9290 / NRRL B-14731 / HIM 762-3) TaxID=485917 RepID=C6XVY0_PEDHD|nr:aminopeptidase P family protein [Pedobacter heparinus]ACU06205.1 Xaa-Pro aminopeptidase [Pedobacter heparinus DSM 2366]